MIRILIILALSVMLTAASIVEPQTDSTSTCPSGTFKCDGACIQSSWICDGEKDCSDGSDEMYCGAIFKDRISRLIDEKMTEAHISFHCGNGNTIHRYWVCDGTHDCPNGSDEENCDGARDKVVKAKKPANATDAPLSSLNTTEAPPCKDGEFACAGGLCIDLNITCDGKFDCPEYDDETWLCFDCISNNCSHTCVDSAYGAKCTCPEGMTLESDGRTCNDQAIPESVNDATDFALASLKTTEAPLCNDGEYRCIGGKCINTSLTCDGKVDCFFGDDENVLCKECSFISYLCSDTCTNTINGAKCSCPEGKTLQSDHRTCIQETIHIHVSGEIKLTSVFPSSSGHHLLEKATGLKLNGLSIEFVNQSAATTTTTDAST